MKAGKLSLKVPKLRRQTFETAIIEHYRRLESSVEEALIEVYLAGVSVRRVEDITEALWGERVSLDTASNLNKKIYAEIDALRHRRIVSFFCLTPGRQFCPNLAAARLRHITGTRWATRKYMNMTPQFADQTQGAVVA